MRLVGELRLKGLAAPPQQFAGGGEWLRLVGELRLKWLRTSPSNLLWSRPLNNPLVNGIAYPNLNTFVLGLVLGDTQLHEIELRIGK